VNFKTGQTRYKQSVPVSNRALTYDKKKVFLPPAFPDDNKTKSVIITWAPLFSSFKKIMLLVKI
jgi:hypothetical protein